MAESTATAVPLERPDIVRLTVRLVGTSPLICHAWSDKAKRQMLDKQMKRAAKAKEAKDPEQDFRDSLYPHPDGGYGFPAVAFKAAVVRAGTYADYKMVFLRGAFHVDGELIQIEGEPTPREDMVRIQQTTDIRYRGEFVKWAANVPVSLNVRVLSVEQLLALFETAGFAVGVGEWRPEKNGQYGRFEVEGTV